MIDVMRRLHAIIPVLAVAVVTVGCGSSSPGSAPDVAASADIRTPEVDATKEARNTRAGNEAEPTWTGPNFEVTTFDGDTFELAAQAGRPVVINFWESW
ncbi:MAG: hypothetical protein ACRDLB_10110 [Actinomycetota bacterium]